MPPSSIERAYLNLRLAEPATVDTNTYLPSQLADLLLSALPEDVREPIPTGGYYINRDHVEHLATVLQEVVAYTVSSIIDAGSERDAVMENDELNAALYHELLGWTRGPGKP